MSKPLVNSVTLDVAEDGVYVNTHLSIPVELDKKIREKFSKAKFEDKDLGVVSFSEKTSELIREAGEQIRNELLEHYEVCETQPNKNGEKSEGKEKE